jgi:Flp pilus assembly protein CpaB
VIGQRALLFLALASGLLAGALYYASVQRVPVVIAARDIDATDPLAPEDLGVASLPPDAVPAGAFGDPSAAVGKVPRAPLWRGQVLLDTGLANEAASFHTGLAMPIGMRAIALPVAAAQAVGGALMPGARVDVIAVPVAGRAPAGRMTELLAQSVMVLDIRTDGGAPYGPPSARGPTSGVAERMGSVVVAIDATDEIRFADRIATSSFILAFVARDE